MWDTEANDWREMIRTVYAYDINGNRIDYCSYIWDSNANVWVGDDRQGYSHDADGNQIEWIIYDWDSNADDWIFLGKLVSYWSKSTTSIINNNSNLSCILYPNPAVDIITIETDKFDHYSIKITSVNGKMIYSGKKEGSSYQIDLSSFHKGIYFITIRSKDFVTTRKIIKL
jgi:hypothetical protein